MSSSKIIKNGRIVTAIDDYIADILIENERIKCIGENLEHGLDTDLSLLRLGAVLQISVKLRCLTL